MARAISHITTLPVAFPSSSASLGIDSIDNRIRDGFQKDSHTFFIWVLLSAFMVAIGVVLEGPEIVFELWPKRFRCFKLDSKERHKKFERWIKMIGWIGWIMVAFGVLGEGIFEGLQNRSEGQLQTFNDILLTDARSKLQSAAESAISAESAARVANGVAEDAGSKANAASATADNASKLASTAGESARSAKDEADQLDVKLKAANTELAELEVKRQNTEAYAPCDRSQSHEYVHERAKWNRRGTAGRRSPNSGHSATH
jgi:hypothetical protein